MFKPNDDVIVEFDGEECRGEVVDTHHGWVLTRINIDPVTDFGDLTPRLDPRSLAMVREHQVRLFDA